MQCLFFGGKQFVLRFGYIYIYIFIVFCVFVCLSKSEIRSDPFHNDIGFGMQAIYYYSYVLCCIGVLFVWHIGRNCGGTSSSVCVCVCVLGNWCVRTERQQQTRLSEDIAAALTAPKMVGYTHREPHWESVKPSGSNRHADCYPLVFAYAMHACIHNIYICVRIIYGLRAHASRVQC